MRESKRFGVVAQNVALDWDAAQKYKDQVVKQMTGGVGFLMKKNKIDTYTGNARLAGRGTVEVESDGKKSTLSGKNIIVAVGAKPNEIPKIGAAIDEDRILSSTGALSLKQAPKSLLIIGGGAIGCEFGSMYRAFGAEITIVEMLPRIVPAEDEEISAELARAFTKRGIKVLTGTGLKSVDRGESQVVATVAGADGKEQQIAAERMLMSIGWQAANNKGIGLEELGVELDQRGFIKVNGMQQTNVEGVYAIGDCTFNGPWLAHKASAEAIVAAEHIAGHHPTPIDYEQVPGCTYCSPEIGSIGLTEAEARERGYEVKVGKFPFSANGKASILGQRNGFVKIVADAKYDEVLGVHIIGPRATELIAEGGVALSHEATAESLMRTIHAHPTLYEALGEAEHAAAEGAAIHI
jgi:dihydrolipoamide dehydrogenase